MAERRVSSRPMEPEPDNTGGGKVYFRFLRSIPIQFHTPLRIYI